MTLLLEHFETLLATPADVEQLNRAILTLAVQGRLVAQDPSDESAHNLIKKIEKEKNEKQISRTATPLLAISEEEIPFAIPKNWIWTRLGNITNYGTSEKSKAAKFSEDTWVLDLEDIEKTTSRLIQRVTLKDRKFQSDKNVFQKGDVIYGKLRPYLDKVIVAEEDGICSSELIPIKTYGGIDPYYLRLALKRPDFIEYVNGKTYGVKMPRLGTQDARMALIPLPPLAEQKRIVARVEALFAQTRALAEKLSRAQGDLEALNQSALAHLLAACVSTGSTTTEEFDRQWDFIAAHFERLFTTPEHIAPLRQSILELAVRGKLTRREAGDESARELLGRIRKEKEERGKKEVFAPVKESEKPFPLPEGWEWARFGELGILERGKSKHRPRNAPFLFENGKYPFVQTGDVAQSKGHITKYSSMYSEEGLAQSKIWKKGTLCITIAANIAETGILEFDACFPDSVVGFVPNPIIGNVDYFQYFIRVAKSRLESYAPATAQKNINLGILQSLLIPLPPVDEIKRIVAKVERLLGLCAALESRLRAAQEERSRLVESVLSAVGAGANSMDKNQLTE